MDVVGLKEAADLLGVTKQRVTKWINQGRFPEPSWRIAAGPVWTISQIRDWAAEHNRVVYE